MSPTQGSSGSLRAGRRPGWRLAAGMMLAVVMLVGCGAADAQPDTIEWRNITLDLPEDWYLFEEEGDRLSMSNQDIGMDAVAGDPEDWPDDEVVAMFFTYEPDTLPDDWRDLLDDLDAEIETDQQLRLRGDVPATQLIYRYETQGVETREMVVVIPSRAVVLLAQPVPGPGDDDVSEVFLTWLDEMMATLETAEFGAPTMDDDRDADVDAGG